MTTITLPIRGTSFKGPPAEEKIIEARDSGSGKVKLEPDHGNRYDRNAVRILIDDLHVGFVPRENAAEVRKWIKLGAIASPIAVVPDWSIRFEVEGLG